MAGAGNLFVKTHPKSTHLWADMPMNPERENAEVGLRLRHQGPVQAAGADRRGQGLRACR